MATEFTQDTLLYFLQSSGGSVKNSDLLLHFRHFIRDHADQKRNREQFKKFVNSLATVKQIDGVSYVILRKKFKGHVTGGGEGGSSEPPPLSARKNTEPSPEDAKLSPAWSTEKPRQKLWEVTTPAPPGVIAGKTILPAAGIVLNNNNNSNMETNLNLKQKRQQVISPPGRPAAAQVVSQISETAQVKTPSLSEPVAPDQCRSTKAQHRVGFELPPGITPAVAAPRHHGETSQQLPVPETLRGREACLQPDGGLHQKPPLHPISLQLQAAPRHIRLRKSYKSAVSCDEEEEEEEEEEVQKRQCSAGGARLLSTISASSPCILDPPVSPSVVSSSSSERKLPEIYVQDVERETMSPRGPGWSLESGVGRRGQWAGPGLEPGSVSGESTRQSLPLEAERYMAPPDRAPEVVPHHDAHAHRRYSQPAGVQLEPRQGPNPSHSSIFSPSSDAPRQIRLRQSYKSAVSCDEEEEVQIRQCSAGGARPLSTPLSDMGRAISASSPCILEPPVSPSAVSSSSSSSERKLPEIYVQDVKRETMSPRGPGWSLESGVGQPGLEPGSVSGEPTRQSLPLEAERYMAPPDRAPEVVPHHDAHADRRYSQPAGVQLEPRQGPNPSQGEWLSSSHSSIFSPSSDVGPSRAPPRGLGWNSSYDDLQARAGETRGGSKIQEALERAQGEKLASVTHCANSKTTAPWHNSTGRLHDDQEPTARLLPFHYSSDYLNDNQNSTSSMAPWQLSTGDIYDRGEAELSEGSTSSPPPGLHPAVVRRLSSHLRSRMCRSLGADLDQLSQEESRAGGGSEAARLNRLHLISSSLSLRYNLSSSSLSSCSTPPRCQSLADLDEGVKWRVGGGGGGGGGRRSSPIAASSTARHEGPSRQSMVPLEPREHAWLVKGAAGSWPDIYTLFREDSSLLNRQDFISGFTVLHWIAKHGDHRVLNTLWYGVEKAGLTFNMNAKSTCGHTPLHIAAIHGNKNIMRLLVNKFNADVKLRDTAGKKAWQYLSSTAQPEVFQLLGAPSRPAGGGDGGVVREDQEPRRQTPRRRRHHLSFASSGERPLTMSGTTRVKRSTSIAAFLKHKSLLQFHGHQSDSSV
ncbi:hypothetical protein EPR50_G00166330 [Perca flavescens]|uniref:SOWAHA-C winged helix-turn-helix domain-containing protein n=1 Tax=Perca flavescens TaxID=8167 RepID=A0A484CDU9_PERFV|nr:uncharacterized protein LOC114571225 isoform X2 [Perca flavescens]TDH01787.1 hypothetical protein EPR50_G00166330 [Perca flavescens]